MNWTNWIRRWIPRPLRHGVQRFVSLESLKRRWRESSDPDAAVQSSDVDTSQCRRVLGIFHNRALFHTQYIRACRELGVPFRVLDLGRDDWWHTVRTSGCDAFLAWPDATQSPWSRLFKDRCELIERVIAKSVYPGIAEAWMYEDKYRLRDWLQAHDVPHPRTWVFVEREAALAFAADCVLPVVFKTGFGAAATGVRILRDRASVRATIQRAFGRGHAPSGHDYRDREWGRVLFQEYLPDVVEWRMVRIGNSYFGHPKGRLGDFHSGSGQVEWTVPEPRHLDLLHQVTEVGGFRSMAVNVFETTDGQLRVNELQTVFGASTSVDQMKVDGRAGRMLRTSDGHWTFEAGDFARNSCANARVLDCLERLGTRI